MMEILKSHFKEDEAEKVKKEIEKDTSFKEIYDKIKNSPDYTLAKLEEKISTKTELNFKERFDAFKKAVLDTENNQIKQKNKELSKQETEKVKKEVEKKWFSWDKVVESFKKDWFFAAVGVFFWTLFSNMFDWIWKKFDKLLGKAEEKIDEVLAKTWKYPKWSFDKNEYISNKKNFDIKFNDDDTVKTILINNEKYKVPKWYKLDTVDSELCLVWGGKVKNNQFPLDYLGYFFDKNFNWRNSYKISEDSNVFNKVEWITPGFMKGDIEFKKESTLDKIEKNILISWKTKIISDSNIDKEKKDQEIIIKEIEINWKKYSLSMWWETKPLKFDLTKKDNYYYIDYWLTTLDLKVSEIENLVNKKHYKIDENNFSLYQLLDDNNKFFDNLKLIRTWEILNSKVWDTIIVHTN